MCDRILTKWAVGFAAVLTLPMSSLRAQELPKSDDSFEVEPPSLIPPGDVEKGIDEARPAPPNAANLAEQLERAKKSAASAQRLVKTGVLSKVEAEQRALRVVRLESELANAQLAAMQEQAALQKKSPQRSWPGEQGRFGRSDGDPCPGQRHGADSGCKISQGAARRRRAKSSTATPTACVRERAEVRRGPGRRETRRPSA